MLFSKWHIDIVSILRKGTYLNCMVVARESATSWVEVRVLSSPTAAAVAKFIYEDIICWYGCVDIVVSDWGPKTKNIIKQLWWKYNTKLIQISPYNHKANGFSEVSHKPIMMALQKLTAGIGL